METIKKWKCTCGKKAEEFSLCDECEAKNKLTAFLEGERDKLQQSLDPDEFLQDHDQRLINTLLDIVWEEIEKKEYCSKCCSPKEYCPEWGKWESALPTEDIKQILTNLKLK